MANFAREYLSSSSLTKFPFSPEADVPERVSRLFCDAVVNIPHGEEFSAVMQDISVSSYLRFTVVVGETSLRFSTFWNNHDHYIVVRSGLSSFVIDCDHFRTSEVFSDPGGYPLSAACADFSPPGVVSFSLMNSKDGKYPVVTDSDITGDVAFIPGTNMRITAEGSALTLAAEPGAGAGAVPCDCEEIEPDEEANEGALILPSTTGDVVLEGDGCLQVNATSSSVVRINGRCTACCPTDKYVEFAGRLAGINNQLTPVHTGLLQLNSEYGRGVSDFNAFLFEPKQDELVLSVTAASPLVQAQAESWSNDKILGRHTKIYVSTKLVNASQSSVTVELQAPITDLAEMEVSGAFASLPVSANSGETTSGQIERDVKYASGTLDIELPSGSAAHVMTVMTTLKPEKHTVIGEHWASQTASFSWTGKEKVNAASGKISYKVVQKKRTVKSNARFTIAKANSKNNKA